MARHTLKRAPQPPQRRTRKRLGAHKALCSIPIPIPASKSSYNDDHAIGTDFYEWVNEPWSRKVKVPPFETDFGVSEEIERCIFSSSKQIIKELSESADGHKNPNGSKMYKDLRDSCMHGAVQKNSVEFLKDILQSIQCIRTTDDVFVHFAELCKRDYASIFNMGYQIETDKTIRLCINSSAPGLYPSYYRDDGILQHYKVLIHKLEELFDIPGLSKIIPLEKHIVARCEEVYSDIKLKIKGSRLETKFPKIPWALWFSALGVEGWRKMVIYYSSPRWIRFIGKMVRDVPLSYWRLYLARCHIINNLQVLPAPFNDAYCTFFGRVINGQQEKTPTEEILVRTVFDFLNDDFSKIFWNRAGDAALVPEIAQFAQSLIDGAKQRIETTEWMMYKTRLNAIKKVANMSIQTVRPDVWPECEEAVLDPRNFLKNIFILRERAWNITLSRIGKTYKFWSEGIYRVNAFYFNETNEIMIPYGSCIAPFYSRSAPAAWNYGGLGGIIGHELCHGFDEEGKEFNEKGERKRWWTRHDNIAYRRNTKALVALYQRQGVTNSAHTMHHVDGESTLSENIADLGGIGIALQTLKDYLRTHYITDPTEIKKEYKTFFCAYATSWRTKIPQAKLVHSLGTDPHAPAFLRVNLVVSQFDEWYAAFDIDSTAPMFVKPEDRIRIF